jgi:hypothetical protein
MQVGSNGYNCRRSAEKALARNVVGGGLALASVLMGCAWIILRPNLTADFVDTDIVAAPVARVAAAQPKAPAAPAAPAGPIAAAPETRDSNVDVALLDVTNSINPSATFSKRPPGQLDYRFAAPATPPAAAPAAPDVPRPPVRRPVQSASLGPPGPAEVRQSLNLEQKARDTKALPSAAADKPKTVFEKLFGKPEQPSIALAYAPSDGGVLGDGQSINLSPPYDRLTAVYDISAATVYMPDGTKLEAHSGLGPMKDDPRNTHVRMRGATPAHVYDIRPREALFHGVAALRLLPVGGEKAIFGRNGILAHTYMLGPRGDSNGCVSFKDYNAFLQAYRRGEVKRLAVVARVE